MSPRRQREAQLERQVRERRRHRATVERGAHEAGGQRSGRSGGGGGGAGSRMLAQGRDVELNDEEAAEEALLRGAFERFDLGKDGRVTLLALKAALGRHAPGEWELRRWVQERDRGQKGYVDFEDFVEFYHATGHGLTPPPSEAGGDGDEPGALALHREAHERHTHASGGSPTTEPGRGSSETNPFEIQARRERAIRQAFDAYDLNGDGVITYLELRTVFARANRQVSELELREWIRARDRSNQGGVTFSDFRAAFLERN